MAKKTKRTEAKWYVVVESVAGKQQAKVVDQSWVNDFDPEEKLAYVGSWYSDHRNASAAADTHNAMLDKSMAALSLSASDNGEVKRTEATDSGKKEKKMSKKAAPRVTSTALPPFKLMNIPLALCYWEHDRDIGKNEAREDNEVQQGSFSALANSVKKDGVETPVIAIELDPDGEPKPSTVDPEQTAVYRIRVGKRRAESAKEAGLKEIPAKVFSHEVESDIDFDAMALRENLLRRNLSPVEKIRGVGKLVDKGYAAPQIAAEIGCTDAAARNLVRCHRKLSEKALAFPGATLEKLIKAARLNTEAEQIAVLDGSASKRGSNGADDGDSDDDDDSDSDGSPTTVEASANATMDSAYKRLSPNDRHLADTFRAHYRKHTHIAAKVAIAELAKAMADSRGMSAPDGDDESDEQEVTDDLN